MSKARKFPLIIWQETKEFQQEYEQVKKRFGTIAERLSSIGFKCTFLGNLSMNIDGNPQVWLNDNKPCYRYYKIEDVIKTALRHGDSGWWTLDELEQFIDLKGPIFESAMWDLGYKKNKIDSIKWVQHRKNDQRPQFNRQNQIEEITRKELERLNELWVLKNKDSESYGIDKYLGVGARGLIYTSLRNPLTVNCIEYSCPLKTIFSYDEGHIAKQQAGFYIDAKNVLLSGQKGIHVKAVKPDKNYVECIWPVQIPKKELFYLAENLFSKVNKVKSVF